MARQCTPRVPHYKYGLYGRYIAHDGGYVQNTFSWRGLATPTHTPDPVIAIVIHRKVCPINVMVFRGHTLLFCTIPYHDAGRVFLMSFLFSFPEKGVHGSKRRLEGARDHDRDIDTHRHSVRARAAVPRAAEARLRGRGVGLIEEVRT